MSENGIIARLHPPMHKDGVRYTGLYKVEFEGDLIVQGSRNPETDLARALLARGLTGNITLIDAETGKPRSIVNIEKAAKLVAEEGPHGPHFVKLRKSRVESPPTAKEDAPDAQ